MINRIMICTKITIPATSDIFRVATNSKPWDLTGASLNLNLDLNLVWTRFGIENVGFGYGRFGLGLDWVWTRVRIW
jgi:hypothetical protein